MRRPALVLALLLAAPAPFACRKPEPPIRIAVHSPPQSLDPHLQNEVLTSAILANVYDGLTEFDAQSRIVPALAAQWRNPDERTWLFRLRPGVRFHDGSPMTAEDVVFSLERARNHAGSGIASYLVGVATVRADGAESVEVRTRRPFAALPAKLTQVGIVPSGSPERIVEPVGTGSYRLVRGGAGGLELEPFAGSWRARRDVRPLRFLVEPNPRRRVEMVLAGEADVAADLPESAVERLREAECCRELAVPGATVEYLRLAESVPAFRDRRVREAVDLALDRAAYVAEAHRGLGLPIAQLVVPGVFGYVPELKPPARDLPRARRLLAEAGYPDGLDVVLEYRPGRRGELLAAQLAEAGIRVTPREVPWTELHPRIRRAEVGFYFGGVVSQTADASDVLDSFVHTRDEARGYGSTNHARYSNPEVDALIEAAAATLDMTGRRALLQDAVRAVAADRFLIPIAGLYEVYAIDRRVRFVPRLDLRLLGREIAREP